MLLLSQHGEPETTAESAKSTPRLAARPWGGGWLAYAHRHACPLPLDELDSFCAAAPRTNYNSYSHQHACLKSHSWDARNEGMASRGFLANKTLSETAACIAGATGLFVFNYAARTGSLQQNWSIQKGNRVVAAMIVHKITPAYYVPAPSDLFSASLSTTVRWRDFYREKQNGRVKNTALGQSPAFWWRHTGWACNWASLPYLVSSSVKWGSWQQSLQEIGGRIKSKIAQKALHPTAWQKRRFTVLLSVFTDEAIQQG